MQEITDSLVCTECGVDFFPNEGGLCNRCKRLFCGEHLFVSQCEPSSRVCQSCRPADAKTLPLLSGLQATSLRARRKMKKSLG